MSSSNKKKKVKGKEICIKNEINIYKKKKGTIRPFERMT